MVKVAFAGAGCLKAFINSSDMAKEQLQLTFDKYASADELSKEDADLLKAAQKATANAHAPYSAFQVGAAVKLVNGEIVLGANQENASFPLGLCAERVALATIASLYPDVKIEAIAVSYDNKKGESKQPISPCGICRQVISEYEQKLQHPIRIIMGGLSGEVYIIPRADLLLPLSFTADSMA